VFFSSHLIPDVEMICDRVGILVGGRLRDQADLHERLVMREAESEVRVAGISPPVYRRACALARRTLARGDEFVFDVPTDGTVEKLIDLVRAEGGRIISITPRRESLEALFLREVRGGAPEEEAPA
jgi:ABC-2 type transport system ATP-binding protein